MYGETNRPACPRLNPEALRRMGPYIDPEPNSVAADIAASERPKLLTRKSFCECSADYNPLGKFGVAWTGHFSWRPPEDR